MRKEEKEGVENAPVSTKFDDKKIVGNDNGGETINRRRRMQK